MSILASQAEPLAYRYSGIEYSGIESIDRFVGLLYLEFPRPSVTGSGIAGSGMFRSRIYWIKRLIFQPSTPFPDPALELIFQKKGLC